VIAQQGRQEELPARLASASRATAERALHEMTARLAAVEEAHHRLLTERDMLRDKADALLSELGGRTAALDGERRMLQQALAAAEHARRDAERAAELLRDQGNRALAALAATREDLASSRAREAALADRIRSRKVMRDADGYQQLRPDPLSAQTPADLVDVLRQFRTWAGNPSYRDMALRSGRRAGASTMCTLLRGSQLPDRLEVIDAIVEGCGGTDDDRQKFATAWRKLAMPGLHTPAVETRLRIIPAAQTGSDRLTG
jgi:hypothetical protein